MSNCSSCNSCSGCSNSLSLTEGELHILETLSQIPFLPIHRKIDDAAPIYLEDDRFSAEEYSLILQHLEVKRLISLDFDKPLKNAAPGPYPIQGSMALTARGQWILDLLERQGIEKAE